MAKKDLELDSIYNLPCFLCEDVERCKNGAEISPITCDKLNRWILSDTVRSSRNERED